MPKIKRRTKPKKENLAIQSIVESWDIGRQIYPTINKRDIDRTFNDWIAICALKNASNSAKIPFKIYVAKGAGMKTLAKTKSLETKEVNYLKQKSNLRGFFTKSQYVEEVLEHPFLDLMKNVNPFMNGFTLLEMTQLDQECTGNAYWYLYKNAFGIPIEIWRIPPSNMYIVPSRENFIAGYVYRSGTEEIPYDTDEIIHFKLPNPHSVYYGLAPWQVITKKISIEENMDTFENSLFENNAKPEGILYTTEVLGDKVFQRVKKDWKDTYGGSKKAGKTAVLEKGLKYQQLTISPKDLNFLQGRKFYKELVAGAYGVPISMLTTENVNLANAYVGDRQYYSSTILPRLLRSEDVINEKMMSIYDTSLFLSFDNPVPEDKEFTLKERDTYIRLGVRLINEIRNEDGLEPVEWGNRPVSMFGNAPISQSNDQKKEGEKEIPAK